MDQRSKVVEEKQIQKYEWNGRVVSVRDRKR